MHTLASYLPVAGIFAALVALQWAIDRWHRRPAVRARYAALSLREKITRNIRTLSGAALAQTGYLVMFASLHAAGIISSGGFLAGTITAGFYLILNLYLLRHALATRRAYGKLGPIAYLAEIQHAFGTGRRNF